MVLVSGIILALSILRVQTCRSLTLSRGLRISMVSSTTAIHTSFLTYVHVCRPYDIGLRPTYRPMRNQYFESNLRLIFSMYSLQYFCHLQDVDQLTRMLTV